jgi:hypothetical protein
MTPPSLLRSLGGDPDPRPSRPGGPGGPMAGCWCWASGVGCGPGLAERAPPSRRSRLGAPEGARGEGVGRTGRRRGLRGSGRRGRPWPWRACRSLASAGGAGRAETVRLLRGPRAPGKASLARMPGGCGHDGAQNLSSRKRLSGRSAPSPLAPSGAPRRLCREGSARSARPGPQPTPLAQHQHPAMGPPGPPGREGRGPGPPRRRAAASWGTTPSGRPPRPSRCRAWHRRPARLPAGLG